MFLNMYGKEVVSQDTSVQNVSQLVEHWPFKLRKPLKPFPRFFLYANYEVKFGEGFASSKHRVHCHNILQDGSISWKIVENKFG